MAQCNNNRDGSGIDSLEAALIRAAICGKKQQFLGSSMVVRPSSQVISSIDCQDR